MFEGYGIKPGCEISTRRDASNIMSLEWWQKNVIYHIYLASFKDSNNDGIGDLQGLLSMLDYFKDLQIATLLLSPFYPSPMKDNGYDITSFTEVDPVYGAMEDFNKLIKEIKKRDMNIILDFVANHTSDQHSWFLKSVENEDPYTDFYVWVDAKTVCEGKPLPPNNWLSVFGGSAWTWNECREQFYLHQFLPEQPDLNYRNPIVKKEIEKAMRFWLEKGIDGFRIDAASHFFEDVHLRDEPIAKNSKAKKDEYEYLNHIYTKCLDENFHLLEEWREILDEFEFKTGKSKLMVVEGAEKTDEIMAYYGSVGAKLADFPLNFQFYKVKKATTGLELLEIIDAWLQNMPKGKYPNWVMSSHDYPRVVSRVGKTLASSLQMVVMLLPGIPICYYGDEIGMQNGVISPKDIRDSFALRTVPKNSRDPMRTPMQWSNERNAGFSNCEKPWLPVNSNYEVINVEAQREVLGSFLENFKCLLKLRQEPAVLVGTFEYLVVNDEIFSFLRFLVNADSYLVIVNMGSKCILVNFSKIEKSLPPEAFVEVSNSNFYFQTEQKRHSKDNKFSSQSNQEMSAAATSASTNAKRDRLKVPLNCIRLGAKEAVVLSFVGSVPRS